MRLLHKFTKPIKTFYQQIKTAELNIQSTTRWGLVQLLISLALFCFSGIIGLLALAFYFLEYYIMWVAYACFGVIVILAICGIAAVIRALSLSSTWLSENSKDPTATKQDLAQLKQDLLNGTTTIIKENLKTISGEGKSNTKITRAKQHQNK